MALWNNTDTEAHRGSMHIEYGVQRVQDDVNRIREGHVVVGLKSLKLTPEPILDCPFCFRLV